MVRERLFGLLMPISALPSGEGIGTLGEQAYRFIDFAKSAGARIWQVLPIVPTNYGDSPYQSCSSTALNYYFIDLHMLADMGLLSEEDINASDLCTTARRVDYSKQFTKKVDLLKKAFKNFDTENTDFKSFVESGKYSDFATFMALKAYHGHRPWTEWSEEYRIYSPDAVKKFESDNTEEILFWQFTQFIFLLQWDALKSYAHESGISVMGDIPLYLAYDSVEMWKYGNELFQVDERRKPSRIAGVPPDAFTDDGQLWGNPLYDWEKMKKNGYKWWNERLAHSFEYFDILRIDHFRGFDRYYAVPVGEPNAKHGEWEKGPAEELFSDKLDWNIVAEDLGVIDDGVRRMMKNLAYPGMKILEFAFDGHADNEHKPSNYTENFVCYTGTHDNMPLTQYINDLSEEGRETFVKDLKKESEKLHLEADDNSAEELCKSVIRLALASKAFAAIIPAWDLLTMGGEARINLPATVSTDNWSFRFKNDELSEELAKKLYRLVKKTGRI